MLVDRTYTHCTHTYVYPRHTHIGANTYTHTRYTHAHTHSFIPPPFSALARDAPPPKADAGSEMRLLCAFPPSATRAGPVRRAVLALRFVPAKKT